MITFTVKISAVTDLLQFPERIEELCLESGLEVHSKGTLSKFKGSTHWHLIKPEKKGTMEVTLYPVKNELYFSAHDNRISDWVLPAMKTLRKSVAEEWSK